MWSEHYSYSCYIIWSGAIGAKSSNRCTINRAFINYTVTYGLFRIVKRIDYLSKIKSTQKKISLTFTRQTRKKLIIQMCKILIYFLIMIKQKCNVTVRF